MDIQKSAIAGTLESSDAQVIVEPSDHGMELSIESSVMNRYGRQIKAVVLETLDRLQVKNGKVAVVDKARYSGAAAFLRKIYLGEAL